MPYREGTQYLSSLNSSLSPISPRPSNHRFIPSFHGIGTGHAKNRLSFVIVVQIRHIALCAEFYDDSV
jgi:hypothetical protein